MTVDWNRFIILLLPIRLRAGTVVAFIRTLLAGLTPTYDKQRSFEADVLYKINHTSQVWSIEAVLNNIFDAESRRIYI